MTPSNPTTDTAARDLRRWHLGSGSAAALPADALPLLLAPFRDPARVRHDYPLVLDRGGDGARVRPLGEALADWAGSHARAQARIVRDNLRRVERRVRQLLRDPVARPAPDVLRDAAERTIGELELRGDVAEGVRSDFDAMLAAAAGIELLPLHEGTALQLLAATARDRVSTARERYHERLRELAEALRKQIAIEAQKDPSARQDTAIQESFGGAAGRFLDAKALSKRVGVHRGTVEADPARRERMESALTMLVDHLTEEHPPALVLVCRDEVTTEDGIGVEACEDTCDGAVARFDHEAQALLPLVRAAWLAELEQRGAFEAERHDPMLAAMDWRDLSPDELATLPVIVALTPAGRLAGVEMQSLASLLTSGRPVHVLCNHTPAHDPAGHDEPSGTSTRLELGYLGMAFREAFVQQTTAARPSHLLQGFQDALRGTRPGLHLVDSGLDRDGKEPPLGSFLHAGAAIEGRAHPLFRYAPEAGETWAKRLDFTFNPSPDGAWPEQTVEVEGRQLRLAFTFADYALLAPHLRANFTVASDELDHGELIDLAAYLELPVDEARHRIPFVWIACADDASPRRAVVRRALADACRDRLRYWRTLQELAGVRNEYVREAVQQARTEAAEEAAREREALQAQHAEELARVREESAGEAMQGLARMLLELDPLALGGVAELSTTAARRAATPSTDGALATADAVAPEAPTEAPPTPAEEEEDDDISEEPWIETPRCSTCNDCVNLNSLLFVYDENKQARIGDATAGTFAQIVEAAEKCPSRCIHPGKPLNPDEPDLEALIARAAPFN